MYSLHVERGRMISPDGSSAMPASERALPASLPWPLGWVEGDALLQSLAQSLQTLSKKTGVDLKLGETPDGEARLLLSRQRLG
jgi:hypothetical protein